MLAGQLPPEALWRTRSKLVSARRRLRSANDDCQTGHDDLIALIERTTQHLVCGAPQSASVWLNLSGPRRCEEGR
jgi:hypothetical protein